MKPKAAAAALILPLLAAAPASAACSIEVRVENRGSGALEVLPRAWDSGVHLLRRPTGEEEEVAGGRSGFLHWDSATVLEPGETTVHVFAVPPGEACDARRRLQIAYRCLGRDIKGIAFAPYPPEGGPPGGVTIRLTRCD